LNMVSFVPAASRSDFSAFFQSKKLKAGFANRLFDLVSRDFIRQVLICRDGAHCTPRLELARQLNAGQIATERAKVGIHFGFENENPHRASTLAGDALIVVNGIV
jgi:hypothetical protein